MKAYVRVVYSSDGSSPETIAKAFVENGFKRMAGLPGFEIDVLNEAEFNSKLEQLHAALKGLEVRYIPTMGIMDGQQTAGYRQRVAKLRDLGMEPMELLALIEESGEQFKTIVLEKMSTIIDGILLERQEELMEQETRLKGERAKARVVELVQEGRTFHDLIKDVEMDEDELSQMLLDLVEKGIVRAEQKGRSVVYKAV